jgi:hypothetical protein
MPPEAELMYPFCTQIVALHERVSAVGTFRLRPAQCLVVRL